MRIEYGTIGRERKALAETISRLTGEQAVYQGMPTAAYRIGVFTLTKDGALEWISSRDTGRARELFDALKEEGYEAAFPEEESIYALAPSAVRQEKQGTEPAAKLSISLPREKFTDAGLENLKCLIEAKGTLMKRAFRTESLEVQVDNEKVSFPWFTAEDPEDASAYAAFVSAIAQMAEKQSRISPKEKPIVNEKYEFRCFLLRLGFIGSDSKQTRKILLKNLTGSAAFKGGSRKGEGDEASE